MVSELRPADPRQTRRALLAGAAGGVLAAVAAALGRPAPVGATHLPGFGHPNNAGSANTTLATNSTGTALLIQQNGTGTALRGQANNGIAGFFTSANGSGVSGVVAANNKYGVYGGNDAASFGGGAAVRAAGKENHGVVATTANPSASAVRGVNSGAGDGVYGEGGAAGVRARNGNFNGFGVDATNDNASFGGGAAVRATGHQNFGLLATSDNIGADAVRGVHSGAGDGVVGESQSGHGVQGSSILGFGVAGYGIDTGGTPYGIYGQAPTNGYAGYFVGNTNVTGTLTKGAGAFKIDHPLDPANRYLYHSFVESPDMLTVYNGNATTDDDGNAVVELPAWFEALNRDYRYQLTVIGQPAQAFVAEEIVGGRFMIGTDRPNVKVSWQVTGIRKDAYAEAHRIPVDESKPADERGTYLHPVEHGQPASKGLDAQRAKPKAPAR